MTKQQPAEARIERYLLVGLVGNAERAQDTGHLGDVGLIG
jgi:hypothetical protein